MSATVNTEIGGAAIGGQAGGGGGSGDVAGPASSTDNAVARFDGTTGKIIQNSAVTIADTTGDITAGKYNTVAISGASTPTLAVTGTTTVAGANTGDQNLFSTIAVSGQSNVVADSASDTLTLAAGSNITITTNASTDTVTIAAATQGWTLVSNQSVGTGNTLDISGIPTTARQIYIAFNGVSVNGSGAALWLVQLIVSGSPVTSGYNSQYHTNSSIVASTAGFPFFFNSTIASEAVVGAMRIFCYDDTNHAYMSDGMSFSAVRNGDYEGQLTAAAQTTGIRLQAPGATTFDAGTVSVWYM